MDRNFLLGTIGDAINALAAAAGYNLRRILDGTIAGYDYDHEMEKLREGLIGFGVRARL